MSYGLASVAKELFGSAGLRRAIGNTGWLIAERVIRLLYGVFVGAWVARFLGPSDFGTLNYAIAFVALFTSLTHFGLHGLVVRDIVRDPPGAGETLGTAFVIRLLGGIVSFALVLLTAAQLHSDATTKVLIAILGTGLVFQAFDVIDLWFQAQVQSKYSVIVKSASIGVAAAAKVAMIVADAPVVAFAAATAAEMALGAVGLVVAYWYQGLRLSAWRATFVRGRELLGQSWPLILSAIGAKINLDIDKVMLGRMADASVVGSYSAAARLSELWYFVPVAIVSSVFPALVRSRQMGQSIYKARMQSLYDVLLCLSVTVALVVALSSDFVVHLLFGNAYADAARILSVHVWAGIFTFQAAALSKWLINEGLLKFSFIRHVLGAIVNVALNLVLIPRYGGMGAAVATVISYATSGWLACFVYPKTRVAGVQMALAFLAPIKLPLQILRGEWRPGGVVEGGRM